MPYEMNVFLTPVSTRGRRKAREIRYVDQKGTFSFALERDMYNKKMYNKKEICIIKKLGLEDYSLGA